MIDTWIEIARGPLFRISLTIFVLGLAYRFIVTFLQIVFAWRRAGDRRLPIKDIVTATFAWLVPVRLFSLRPTFGIASIVFHIGMLLTPIFLLGHVSLLGLPSWWPTLSPGFADTLTIATIIAIGVLIGLRVSVKASRALSRPQDLALLVILLAVVGFGFVAANPEFSPFAARSMVLMHILTANLVLMLTPFSKIAHCVLYPLLQLVFQLGWHFPAETGRHVALALDKENEPI